METTTSHLAQAVSSFLTSCTPRVEHQGVITLREIPFHLPATYISHESNTASISSNTSMMRGRMAEDFWLSKELSSIDWLTQVSSRAFGPIYKLLNLLGGSAQASCAVEDGAPGSGVAANGLSYTTFRMPLHKEESKKDFGRQPGYVPVWQKILKVDKRNHLSSVHHK